MVGERYICYAYVCTYMQAIRYETKKAIRKAYHRLLDSSETLDHWDSVISWKILRPIKGKVQEIKEARRLRKVNYGAF